MTWLGSVELTTKTMSKIVNTQSLCRKKIIAEGCLAFSGRYGRMPLKLMEIVGDEFLHHI